MRLFKSLYRKLFEVKTGSYETEIDWEYLKVNAIHENSLIKRLADNERLAETRDAYDPSKDEERILRGENESYFE